MSVNIVDLVKNYASSELISKAGSFLGESESGVSKAVSGLIPSLLGGVVSKATSSDAGAVEIFETAQASHNSGILNNLSSLFGNADLLSKGTGLFNSILGNKANILIDAISNFAGVKSSSSSSLISLIMPLITGVLGKQAAENNMNAGSFGNFLAGQKNNILSALPAGLSSIGGLLGLGSVETNVKESVENIREEVKPTYDHVADEVSKPSGNKWLLPLLIIAALALLLWYFMKGCNKTDGTVATGDTTTVIQDNTNLANSTTATVKGAYDSVTGNYIYEVGANKEIKLADGTVLTVGENSTEAKLFDFLSTGTVDTVDKSKGWITLDRVYFETGKSVLTQASQQQLKNIAAIMKSFPTAAVKMGGYTDNTGAAATNVKLSGDRAKIAASELVKLGVAGANVASEGYGPEHPVCAANDTPECKAQNRRVDIRVTQK